MSTMDNLLGGLTGDGQKEWAHKLATLPMRFGGLAIRSAMRMSHAAYSWADALHMIAGRLPQVADQVLAELAQDTNQGCIGELRETAVRLDREGFVNRPGWIALKDGQRPEAVEMWEPGEWHHGWQYCASSCSEYHCRETVVLAQSCAADQAHLRSHSGPGTADVFLGCPMGLEFKLQPVVFRTLALERSRLPLQVSEVACICGTRLDSRGRHRAACPRSGLLRIRATPTERTLARVCREAGATVRCNTKLRDLNIGVSLQDERAIEVVASGLPFHHGAQLAVDITLRGATTAAGLPCTNAAHTNGAVLHRAMEKAAKYSELLEGGRCQLVVVGIETGGRWSSEAADFVEMMAQAKAREAPQVLQWSVHLSWRRRWMRMLSLSCARAFAICLVSNVDA